MCYWNCYSNITFLLKSQSAFLFHHTIHMTLHEHISHTSTSDLQHAEHLHFSLVTTYTDWVICMSQQTYRWCWPHGFYLSVALKPKWLALHNHDVICKVRNHKVLAKVPTVLCSSLVKSPVGCIPYYVTYGFTLCPKHTAGCDSMQNDNKVPAEDHGDKIRKWKPRHSSVWS